MKADWCHSELLCQEYKWTMIKDWLCGCYLCKKTRLALTVVVIQHCECYDSLIVHITGMKHVCLDFSQELYLQLRK